jgi:hypothetical protein
VDERGSFANGDTSAQVAWSGSDNPQTSDSTSNNLVLSTVTVEVHGKENKIITLTARYQRAVQ